MNAAFIENSYTSQSRGEYDHRQNAPMYWLILLPAIVMLVFALSHSDEPAAIIIFFACAPLFFVAMSFRWLRVVDEGTGLAVRYGPLPFFWKRFRYAEIATAEPDKTSFIDGWGIHWVPGRGWTYNLWGFECVRLTLKNGRTVRVGTDDPSGLAAFLQQKLGSIR